MTWGAGKRLRVTLLEVRVDFKALLGVLERGVEALEVLAGIRERELRAGELREVKPVGLEGLRRIDDRERWKEEMQKVRDRGEDVEMDDVFWGARR